jgi:hypothetical protein
VDRNKAVVDKGISPKVKKSQIMMIASACAKEFEKLA